MSLVSTYNNISYFDIKLIYDFYFYKANEWGNWTAFFETSAKHNINVEKCFFEIVRICREKRYNPNKYKQNKAKNCIIQ